MRIAFCGTRGLPAKYGGFETAVQEITSRMAAAGVECDVFCRGHMYNKKLEVFEGRNLVYVPGSTKRSLDTFVSSIQTGWYLLLNRKQYDYIFWFNNANLPGILMTLLSGVPMSVNTDGLEWRRPKWSLPFKFYYFAASAIIAKLCNLISDSRELSIYYRKRFGASSTFIPYGVPQLPQISATRSAEILRQYGVEPGKYSLQITRIEADNLPVEAAEGFLKSGLAKKGFKHLVIGYSHETAYSLKLKSLENPDDEHLLVREAVYDADVITVLRRHCSLYIHGNSVGGTNPALLEAMQLCPRVLAIDTPFSRETLGELGEFFTVASLPNDFQRAVGSADKSKQLHGRIEQLYDWDAVADSYLALATQNELALKQPSLLNSGKI
jgi:glycosyltransferase involved in cell wall biosynthesis